MYLCRLQRHSRGCNGKVIAILRVVDEVELAKLVTRIISEACDSEHVGMRVDQRRLCSSCSRI